MNPDWIPDSPRKAVGSARRANAGQISPVRLVAAPGKTRDASQVCDRLVARATVSRTVPLAGERSTPLPRPHSPAMADPTLPLTASFITDAPNLAYRVGDLDVGMTEVLLHHLEAPRSPPPSRQKRRRTGVSEIMPAKELRDLRPRFRDLPPGTLSLRSTLTPMIRKHESRRALSHLSGHFS